MIVDILEAHAAEAKYRNVLSRSAVRPVDHDLSVAEIPESAEMSAGTSIMTFLPDNHKMGFYTCLNTVRSSKHGGRQ